MRRISSAHQSAQRFTSAGVLGQRADARNREQRLQLVEVAVAVDVDEVDDVVHVGCSSGTAGCHRPSVVDAATLALQLFEMRAHVFARRRHQRRRETIIDGFGNRLHGRVAGAAARRSPAARACAAMLEVAVEHRVAGRRSPGRAPAAAAAAASASSRSSDARYWPRSPPRLQWIITLLPWTTRSPVKIVRARLVPEREVIRRMPRRVQHGQRFVAGRHDVAVARAAARHRIAARPRRARQLRERRRRIARARAPARRRRDPRGRA